MRKAILAGAVAAFVLVAVLSAGRLSYLRSIKEVTNANPEGRIVLVFESTAEDGATVAALVSVVADGRMKDVSPGTTVTIPGTSSSQLGDAFVFGGGAAVARALEETASGPGGGVAPFVSVPAPVWRAAVQARRGVYVDVPEKVTAFDGTKLITINPGAQTLSADQVGTLLAGLSYIHPAKSAALRLELEQQLGAALVVALAEGDRLDSDLPPTEVQRWLHDELAVAVTPQVD